MDLILTLWSEFGLKDLIDILLVSILIYQIIILVHGTRAVQIILGIIILTILFWAGIQWNLYSLNWLLAHFFDSFFIIVIILFQDQIRAALAHIASQGKILSSNKLDTSDTEIEEVLEALDVLSLEKIGALIVFERVNGLSDVIETGTKIKSKIYSDLIYSIFQSASPIHDGSIIISDNEISSVGCFLPLSKNIDLDKKLGTRHRAALGITEITDAVAIVVSEETGKLKLAVDGKFYDKKNTEQLRISLKYLLEHNSLDKLLVADV